jgi:hypothetical protein
MVNRGDGGARRPAPPSARPAPRPAGRPAPDEEAEEKTSAINLADVNLDEIDAMPSKPMPAKKFGNRDFGDDDNEATNAINLANMNLDDDDDEPSRPAPAARPQPSSRPAPSAAPAPAKPAGRAPAPAPSRAAPPPEDDGEEKTSAVNLNDLNREEVIAAARAKLAAAKAPAPAAAPVPRTLSTRQPEVAAPAPRAAPKAEPPKREAPAPAARPAPKKVEEEPSVDRTMAVSMDDIEAARPAALAKLKAMKAGKPEPAAADKTFLVDDEDVPVVKAPEPKRVPAALQGKAAAAAAAPSRSGSGVIEPEPKLLVVAGPDKGRVYPLTKDLTLIGRGVDADCVINDASASRKHFNIVRTLHGWKLVDLGSGNGTKVDGNRVSEITLLAGMKIEAGGTTLEWMMETPAGAGPAKLEASGPPPGRSPTLQPSHEEAKPSRRVQAEEDKPKQGLERKRDPSRLEKLADLDDEKPKSKLGAKSMGSDDEPPEKTTFGDIAALEIDPEWEARRVKQRRDGVAPGASAAAEAVEEEVEAPSGSGKGKKIAIAAALVAVLGGGFVAADKFAGLGIIFPKAATVTKPTEADKPKEPEKTADSDKPKEPVKEPVEPDEPTEDKGDKVDPNKATADGDKPPADAGKGDAKALVAKADEAAKGKRYIEAARGYKAAIAVEELVEGGEEGLANVAKQVASLGPLVEALAMVETRAFFDMHKKFEEIPEFSVYRPVVAEVVETAKEDLIVDLIAKTSELMMKGDYKGAKDPIKAALELAGPEYAEGAALKDAVDRGLSAEANKRESDPTQDATPSDLTPGLEAYKKGDYTGAADKFAGIEYEPNASKADVGKAKVFSAASFTFDETMKVVATLKDKPEEAVGYMRSARRADAIMGLGQKAAVDVVYATAAGFQAKQAAEKGELEFASLKARVALAIDPAQADAKAALDKVIEAAKPLVAEAKAAAEATPDKAAGLVIKALRLLPSSAPEHAEALALAKALATP